MKVEIRFFIFLALTSIMAICTPEGGKDRVTSDVHLDYAAIADEIMARCELQSGEQVLLVGQPGRFDPLIPLLKKGIENAGAVYLGTSSVDSSLQFDSWSTEFTRSVSAMSDIELPLFLSAVQLGIMLPGATPTNRVYAGLQKVLSDGSGRTIHFHWEGAYHLDGSPIVVDSAIDIFYQNALLKTDYAALASKQVEFENAMRNNWVHVTTPAGTDIKFQIGDRQVTKQDGNASRAHMNEAKTLIDREVELPPGAIRVAPIEETVDGVIVFPDSDWLGKRVIKPTMKFEKGKVIKVSADENAALVQQEIDQAGEAGRSFREFALGFNPMLAIPSEDLWIPYYGYGAGVVRLSLGDNSELGGKITGGYVRWNFFTDATVTVGDEIWIDAGKLIK
ncbi:MAG TPA: aminopeptidase [Cyclobacteriaceae bacterium]